MRILEWGVHGEVKRESRRDQRTAERWCHHRDEGGGGVGGLLTEQHGRRSRQKHALNGPVGSEKRPQARITTEVEETGLGNKCETGG